MRKSPGEAILNEYDFYEKDASGPGPVRPGGTAQRGNLSQLDNIAHGLGKIAGSRQASGGR